MEADVRTAVLVGGTGMLKRFANRPSVVVAHVVVGPSDPEGVLVRVINHPLGIATVYNGTKIAVLEPNEDVMTVAPVQQPDTPLRSSEDRQVEKEAKLQLG